ncbi:alpha/beta hydrolase, partial [Pseudomonas aeruginosa]|uniref:alpha/beta hydrolase n=1 Tax=Pseudomonas aeruginosa TaxID=287 RepID=UPI003C6DE510
QENRLAQLGTFAAVQQVVQQDRPTSALSAEVPGRRQVEFGSLLLMHGYYDHMGLYRHVVDWALGMGFSVLACDLPGHGLSE